MGLDGFDHRADIDQLAQPFAPEFRHGQLFPQLQVDFFDRFVIRIGDIHQPAAIGGQQFFHMGADGGLRPFLPVVPVQDIVRTDQGNHVVIQHILLDHHFRHALHGPVELYPLLLGNGRKLVIADQRPVGKGAHNHFSPLAGLPDDIYVPLVDDVGAETGIDGLHFFPP